MYNVYKHRTVYTTPSIKVYIKIQSGSYSSFPGASYQTKMGTRPNNFHLFNEGVKYKYIEVKLQFQFTPLHINTGL